MWAKNDGKVSGKTQQFPNQLSQGISLPGPLRGDIMVLLWSGYWSGLSKNWIIFFFQYSNYFAIHSPVLPSLIYNPCFILILTFFLCILSLITLLKCMNQKVGWTGMTNTHRVWFREFVIRYVFWVVKEIRFCH